MEAQLNNLISLRPEEKQQILYAALLRYTSEAQHLRHKALDYVVRSALIGTDENHSYRIGAIQRRLWIGNDSPQFRVETIQETLKRLINDGKVNEVEVNKHHTYYLKPGANEDLNQAYNSATNMFDKVLHQMLKDTDHLISPDIANSVCRAFILECFSRFGRQIAKTVTGQWTHDELLRETDAEAAFLAAVKNRDISQQAMASLRVRCLNFLRSRDVDAENLRFHLTQGYYFTELLGLDQGKFIPLTAEAFTGAVFYLDTNVLIPRLIATREEAALFDEMLRIASRMGIDIRVTRATMNEARRVAADHTGQLKSLIATYPEDILQELGQRTSDHFIQAFLSAKKENPALTPEELVEPFDHIREVLEDQMGITVFDKTEEEVIAGRDFSKAAEIMQQSAQNIRKFSKSERTLNHDVCHYALVLDDRQDNTKSWFLTRDRSLLDASSKLAAGQQSFCFSLVGFLQSLSPFLTTPAEERSVVEVFSDFVTEQVFPVGPIFDIRGLKVFAEYHEDVITTNPDQVVMALHYVKEFVLQGKPYKTSDMGKVSLELKKFLASSADERIQVLAKEKERLAKEAEIARVQSETERRRVEAAQDEADEVRQENIRLRSEVDILTTGDQRNRKELDDLAAQLANQRQQVRNTQHQIEQRERRDYMLTGFLVAVLYWIFDDVLIGYILRWWETIAVFENYIRMVLSTVAALAFILPALPFIQNCRWPEEKRLAVISVTVITALVFSKILDNPFFSAVANMVDFGGLIAAIIFFFFITKNKEKEEH